MRTSSASWLYMLLLTALVSAHCETENENEKKTKQFTVTGKLLCYGRPQPFVTVELLERDVFRGYGVDEVHKYEMLDHSQTTRNGSFRIAGNHDETLLFEPKIHIVGAKCYPYCDGTLDFVLGFGSIRTSTTTHNLGDYDMKVVCYTKERFTNAYKKPVMPKDMHINEDDVTYLEASEEAEELND